MGSLEAVGRGWLRREGHAIFRLGRAQVAEIKTPTAMALCAKTVPPTA
jgi:hypothetical protein